MGSTAEVIAGFLRVEEAEMLTELLASAGIEAWFEGAVTACLGPLLPGAGGGARLLVRAGDADRARELIAQSGLLAGGGSPPGPAQDGEQAGRAVFPLYPVLVALLVVGATLARLWIGG